MFLRWRDGDEDTIDTLLQALYPDLKRRVLIDGRVKEIHRAIELQYFGRLTLKETGEVLDIPSPTVMQDFRFAEARLAHEWGGSIGAP